MRVASRDRPASRTFDENIKVQRGTGKAMVAMSCQFLNPIFDILNHDWMFEDVIPLTLKSCHESEEEEAVSLPSPGESGAPRQHGCPDHDCDWLRGQWRPEPDKTTAEKTGQKAPKRLGHDGVQHDQNDSR